MGLNSEVSNYRVLSSHAPGEKQSLQAIQPVAFILHFHDPKILTCRFVTKHDVIMHGYNIVVYDNLPRFLTNYAHAQTVDIPGYSFVGGYGLGVRLMFTFPSLLRPARVQVETAAQQSLE